jgi:hypothetical protein
MIKLFRELAWRANHPRPRETRRSLPIPRAMPARSTLAAAARPRNHRMPRRSAAFVGARDVSGEWSDVRGQRSEVRGQRPEVSGQRSEVSGQRSEVSGQRSEVRGQRSAVRGQRSEVRGQRSEVRGQRSEVRGQRSEVRGQRSVACRARARIAMLGEEEPLPPHAKRAAPTPARPAPAERSGQLQPPGFHPPRPEPLIAGQPSPETGHAVGVEHCQPAISRGIDRARRGGG